jgi:hypothetical protein
MEEFRSAIAIVVAKRLKGIDQRSVDYFHQQFWSKVERDLFCCDRMFDIPPFAYFYLSPIIGEIVEQLDLDRLVSHVTSGGQSLGEVWLNQRIAAISDAVVKAIVED